MSSRRRWRRPACRARPLSRWSRPRCPWPRTGPGPRSRRCARWRHATRTSSRRWHRCGRRWPRTTRWAPTTAPPPLGARRPSRLHAIEELPVALGMLLVSGGDFRHAVLGAVNYGRDCDSIATMAGALAGALGSPVPEDWAKTVAEASRLDLWEPAATLTRVAREVFERDVRRRRAHEDAFAAIGGAGCSG
ncbi:ADP-ribosylglycohydrolase family protein [Streptomyces tendae]|uniref:ADP-ribosylglycohydrolase family protein n=1 Tax=Streptomyces tendae TaxID=1932 RepID=UPI00343558EE